MVQNPSRMSATKTEPEPEDEFPVDMDEFRFALARRINMAIGDRKKLWRGCRERSCRRARHCLSPRNTCSNPLPLPPMSPEEQALACDKARRSLEAALRRAGER